MEAQYFNFSKLPKDVQMHYLSQLSPDDLINMYSTNIYFHDLLNKQYVLNYLIYIYNLQNYVPKITTFN